MLQFTMLNGPPVLIPPPLEVAVLFSIAIFDKFKVPRVKYNPPPAVAAFPLNAAYRPGSRSTNSTLIVPLI